MGAGTAHPESGQVRLPASPGSTEDMALRDEFSRTFINPDGSRTKQQSHAPIHYKDGQGRWMTIQKVPERSGSAIGLTRTDLPISVNTASGTSDMYLQRNRMISFGAHAQMTYLGSDLSVLSSVSQSAPSGHAFSGSDVVLKDLFPSVDRKQTLEYDHLRTDFVVRQQPVLPASAAYVAFEDVVQLPQGWKIRYGSGTMTAAGWKGSLEIADEQDVPAGNYSVPVFYDAFEASSKSQLSGHIVKGTYKIQQVAGGYKVTILVPASWLLASDRVYPVTIDPTVSGTKAQYGNVKGYAFDAACQETITINIPAGTITNTASTYNITAQNGGYRSEQVSRVGSGGVWSANQTNTTNSGGVQSYNLTTLTIANGTWCGGNKIFVWQAYRTWDYDGFNDCDQYNQYRSGDWVVTVTYNTPALGTTIGWTAASGVAPAAPTCGNWSATWCSGSGTYTDLSLIQGVNYSVENTGAATCGSALATAYLQAWWSGGATACGYGAIDSPGTNSIAFNAQITGGHRIGLSSNTCGVANTCGGALGHDFSGSSAVLRYRQNTTVTNTTSAADLCFPGTRALTATLGGGHNNPAITWTIVSGGGSISGTTYTPASTGSKTLRATVGNCSSDVTFNVVNASAVSVSGTTAICAGGSTVLTASGGSSYSWSPATGLSATTGASVTASPASTQTYTVSETSGGCATDGTVTVTVNSSVTPAFNAVAPICEGAALAALPTTSNNGITGTWSPALDNTTTTTYTFTPDAGQCATTTTLTITVNPNIAPAFTAVAAICAGGTLAPLPTTSNNGVTGSWSPALDNTTTTTYTFTPDAGQCAATATLTVTVKPLPSAAVTASVSSICPGETATLTASGGTSYSWSPSTGLDATTGAVVHASPASTQTYTVTATDNGCIATANVTITVNSLAIAVSADVTSVCAGESATLTASGATSYTWAPATGLNTTTGNEVIASPTATQTYTVTGTDGVCTGTQNITITVKPNPTVSVTPSSASLCLGNSITLTGVGASTYVWLPTLSSGPTVTVSPTTTTTYTALGTATNGCVGQGTATITVTTPPAATISYSGLPYCTSTSTPQSVTRTGTAGGTYTATPAGLSVNASTGAITPSTSSAGTYTVTYTIPASGGCAMFTTTTSVTVNAAPVATITYPGSPFCGNLSASQNVSRTGASGGTYSSTPGLTLDPATGAVTPSTSTPGTYTVTYTIPAASGCPAVTATASVTITAPPSATISYAGTPFCTNLSAPQTVTHTGTTGGTYTSGAGLSINASTGAITPSTSSPGTYTVTYTVAAAGGCPVLTTTTSISIIALPVATITYPGSPFCGSLSSAQNVSQTGTTGGTYSSTPGLTLNPSTGAVTPSTSTAGTYTVTYTIPAGSGCPAVTATTSVTVTTPPSAAISYASPFCTSLSTPQAVTHTGTTGGVYSSTTGLTINASTGAITPSTSTAGTYTVTYTVAAAGGCPVYTSTASVTITALPVATITYPGSPFCGNLSSAQNVSQTGTTGGTYTSTPGLTIDAATGAIMPSTSTAGTYTVTYTIPAGSGCPAVTATTSVTITTPPSAAINYASPFCTNISSPQAVTHSGTTGGTYSSTTGLTINPTTGAITPSTSTAGTYTVTYTIAAAGGCPVYTTTASVTITALPVATISYPGSPFCGNLSAPQNVSQTGTTGGTYTSTTGLTINASTGAITPSTSTAGTYTVTYTLPAAGGCPAVTATASVTITTAPSATISYASPFCKSVTAAQAVTHTGTTGGTYSASPAGLTINSTTGAITPSSSTAGTYTVTYTIAAAGGCPVYTTTASVTINPVPVATISYAGTPFCGNISAAQNVTQTGTAGGTYTSATGLSIDASTGAITPSTSTPGTYTVTYTIAASGGCAAVTATASVTINPAPAATISYAGSPFCSSVSTAQSVTLTGTGGGIFSSTPGLTISAVNGAITPSASIPGTYTVTYTIAAANGCPATTATASVTVNPIPSATISYSGSPFCGSLTTAQNVTQTGTTGGTYTASPAGLSINASTGAFTPSASTPGTYTVTYTVSAGSGCPAVTTTASVTITTPPAATISYAGSPYCTSITATQAVTHTGTTGGTYSASPSGLTINASTGAITPSTSTPGTYTVTYTMAAANGCPSSSVTASVTVNPLPAATISYSGSPFCGNLGAQNVTQTGTSGGTYTSAAGLSLNASTGAITPSASVAGTYTITYTIAAGSGCPAVTAITSVTITALPAATISYSGSPYCTSVTAAQAVTHTGTTGGVYSASPAGLTINATTGAITPSASAAGTYTVTYTMAAANGCPAVTATATVTVTTAPAATISYAGSPFCASVTGAQPVTHAGTTGGTYTASPSGLTINTSTGAITPSTSAPGTYTVTYTVAASGGCAAVNATASVVINAVPTASIAYSSAQFCSSISTAQPVVLTGTIGGTYSASPAGLSINASTGAITPSAGTPGNYTVTYTVTPAGCGTVSASAAVEIVLSPTASISYAGSPYCGSVPTAQPVTLNGTGNYLGGTYSASPAGLSIDPATGSITPNLSTAGTYLVTYTVPASSGCSAGTATVNVTITATPGATISYTGSPFCTGLSGAQNVSFTGTTGGSYSASPSGLTINPVTGAITLSSSTPGTYVVTYTTISAGGCPPGTATSTIAIFGTPVINDLADQVLCDATYTLPAITGTYLSGNEMYYTAPNGGGTAYAAGDVISSTTQLYIYDANGSCSDEESVLITINQTPAINDPGNQSACGSYTLPAITGTNLSGSQAYYNNSQALGGTVITGPVTTSQTVWIYDSNGSCSDEVSFTVTISPVPDASFTASDYCGGTGAAPVITGAAGGTFSFNPVATDGATIDPATGVISGGVTGTTYTIQYTVSGSCTASSVQQVSFNAVPAAPSAGNNATYCSAETFAPMTATAAAGGTLRWYDNAALTSQVGTGTSVIPANVNGTTTYYVTETVNGCQSLPATVDITVNPSPAAPSAGNSITYCKGDSIAVLTATGLSGSTFTWYEDAALTIQYATGSTAKPLNTLGAKTYYVTQTGNGCESAAASVTITINDCFELDVTTAFTPGDGDNTNDTWEIPELNARYPDCHVTIFNRWGQLLFESNGYAIPWDGKYKGEYLPVGSYYYIIELNDGKNSPNVRGTVTIIRN